jgi:hypothetical protein
MVQCVLLVSSAHHKPSRGGRSNNGEDLDRGREKAASRTDRGLAQARHLHSRQKRGGSHRVGHHGCPHPVTREPFSSWTASTSRHGAFQQEVASSELGGTWQKGGNPLGSRQEGKGGTPGPLLPAEENARSQSWGCQPATACLEGRWSHHRRLISIGLRAGFIRYIWKVSEPGKKCRVRFLHLSSKHVPCFCPGFRQKRLRSS